MHWHIGKSILLCTKDSAYFLMEPLHSGNSYFFSNQVYLEHSRMTTYNSIQANFTYLICQHLHKVVNKSAPFESVSLIFPDSLILKLSSWTFRNLGQRNVPALNVSLSFQEKHLAKRKSNFWMWENEAIHKENTCVLEKGRGLFLYTIKAFISRNKKLSSFNFPQQDLSVILHRLLLIQIIQQTCCERFAWVIYFCKNPQFLSKKKI